MMRRKPGDSGERLRGRGAGGGVPWCLVVVGDSCERFYFMIFSSENFEITDVRGSSTTFGTDSCPCSGMSLCYLTLLQVVVVVGTEVEVLEVAAEADHPADGTSPNSKTTHL